MDDNLSISPKRLSTHDLTWRSTLHHSRIEIQNDTFNSRPHMEVDPHRLQCHQTDTLSTHDLTWRSTRPSHTDQLMIRLLSTHDLTWRSTFPCGTVPGQPAHFQLTTSHGGRLAINWSWRWSFPFNSRPHMEVDQDQLMARQQRDTFNSRPHMEVDVVTINHHRQTSTFNSRPHMEVDF